MDKNELFSRGDDTSLEAACPEVRGESNLDEREFERDFGRPILIFTVGRSGSSLVAGLLASMGCWAGHCKPGDRYNPKGYFENTELKRFLKQIHGFGLLDGFPPTQIGWRRQVRKKVIAQGYRGGPWLFKTGVHYADVWDEFDPFIIKVMRDRERILESYARYGGIWRSFGPEDATRIVDRGLEKLKSLPGLEVDIDQLSEFVVPGAFHAG